MSEIIRFGIDLAKNSFALCGVDAHERVVLQQSLKRAELLGFFANRPPALIAMESGSGAHHWARQLRALGHQPRLLDPRLVAPYRRQGRSGKNDRNDAVAICEAAGRPGMRFVPVKSLQQQAVLAIHRLRRACVAEHTRTLNRMRGILAEFGIIAPRGAERFVTGWAALRRQHDPQLPSLVRQALEQQYQELNRLHQQLLAYNRQINALVRADPRAQRLTRINGIGPITASALVATLGNGRDFRNGRQLAAWLGLTPRQYSSGGRLRLGRISKRGDVYLRTLLVHGARSELRHTARRSDRKSRWAESLKRSKSWNKAAVALANKHARIAWALLAHEQDFTPA